MASERLQLRTQNFVHMFPGTLKFFSTRDRGQVHMTPKFLTVKRQSEQETLTAYKAYVRAI